MNKETNNIKWLSKRPGSNVLLHILKEEWVRAFDGTIHYGEEEFLVSGLWFPWIPSAYQNQGFESRISLDFFFQDFVSKLLQNSANKWPRLSSFIYLTLLVWLALHKKVYGVFPQVYTGWFKQRARPPHFIFNRPLSRGGHFVWRDLKSFVYTRLASFSLRG